MTARSVYTWIAALVLVLTLAAGCAKGPGTRSDTDIAAEVQSKINADPNLPNKAITVNSTNGAVTLSGTVATETERLTAANTAGQVDGVKTVINNLQVGGASAALAPSQPMSAGNTEPANVRPAAPARRTAPAAPPVARSTPQGSSGIASSPAPATRVTVTVPAGTELNIRVNDELSTATATNGQTFTGTLDSPVYVGDGIAIPSHADVQGRVVEVKSAGKFAGRSELFLTLTSISYNGRSYNIDTDTWRKYGASRGKNTAAKVGGGAAIGAVIGGIAGGGKGAAIGAGIGAGAGTGAQAITKSEQIVIAPEAQLTFKLEKPVAVAPAGNAQGSRRPMTSNP